MAVPTATPEVLAAQDRVVSTLRTVQHFAQRAGFVLDLLLQHHDGVDQSLYAIGAYTFPLPPAPCPPGWALRSTAGEAAARGPAADPPVAGTRGSGGGRFTESVVE